MTPINADYDRIAAFSEGLAAVYDEESGKYGFINTNGELVIPMEYYPALIGEDLYLPMFRAGVASVRNKDGLYGCINKSGECIIPFRFDEIGEFDTDGYIAGAVLDGKTCFINIKGELEDGEDFLPCDGLRRCVRGGVFGYVDSQGNTVIPFEYDYDPDLMWDCGFDELGLLRVRKDGKWGFIDRSGRVIIPVELEYDRVFGFACGVAGVSKDGLFGFIDVTGREVIPLTEMISSGYFVDGRLAILKGDPRSGKRIMIDTSGRVIADLSRFDMIEWPGSPTAIIARKDGKCGVIDHDGDVIVPLQYEDIRLDLDGMRAKLNGKWGVTDACYRPVTPFEYDEIGEFRCGFADYERDGGVGMMASDGHELTPPVYDEVDYRYNSNEYAIVRKGGRFGMMNARGELVLPVEYDEITYFGDVGTVRRDGKWWVIREETA